MHPVLFSCGGLTVFSYGTMLALGFLAGIAVSLWIAKMKNIPADTILDLAVWLMVFSVAGARIAYVVFFWRDFSASPIEIIMLQHGGLAFYGGFVGALIAVIWKSRSNNISLWKLLDVITPGTVLGYAIGRIGCFLNGCCYGIETNLPWAVHFPALQGLRHPTQIYASFTAFVIFLVLIYLTRKDYFDGRVFLSGALLYCVYRFFIEFIREGPRVMMGLTASQVFSVLVFVLAIGTLVWRMSKSPPSSSHGGTAADRQNPNE